MVEAGQALRRALIEYVALRRECYYGCTCLRLKRRNSLEQGIGAHHHARPSPEGGIVCRVMPVVGEIAQIVHTNVSEPAAYGPPNDARFQHRPEHFRGKR